MKILKHFKSLSSVIVKSLANGLFEINDDKLNKK